MTAKEKAKELVEKYKLNLRTDNRSWEVEAKKCALIAIDEIINICPYISKNAEYITIEQIRSENYMFVEYWLEITKEIEKL